MVAEIQPFSLYCNDHFLSFTDTDTTLINSDVFVTDLYVYVNLCCLIIISSSRDSKFDDFTKICKKMKRKDEIVDKTTLSMEHVYGEVGENSTENVELQTVMKKQGTIKFFHLISACQCLFNISTSFGYFQPS